MGRRVSLLLAGGGLFAGVALVGQENMQLEGFFVGLVTGVFQAARVHYLVAEVLGPLIFGRVWCGWACWTVMVLHCLPHQRSSGRLPSRWGQLRRLHFALSVGLVLMLWYGLGHGLGHGLTARGPTAVVPAQGGR